MNGYREGIAELESLDNKHNSNLLKRYSHIIQLNHNERTIKEEMVAASLHVWIMNNLFELVSCGKTDEAKSDLKILSQHDNKQQDLYLRLTQVIIDGEMNQDQSADFWLNEYKKSIDNEKLISIDKKDKDYDNNAMAVTIMTKTLAFKALFTLAAERGQLGFNREAAEMIKKLKLLDPTLNLNDIEDDFNFAHHGQVLNIFTKPLQNVLVREVRNWQPSIQRTAALVGLELINTAQVIVPNAISLAAQAAHAHCVTGNMCIVNRNVVNVWTQLSRDINPFDAKYNPINFNGIMIYSQLLLKTAQHFPLEWIVSPKNLYSAENIRNTIVSRGNLALRATFTVSAGFQLKNAIDLKKGIFANAYTPLTLATIASFANFGIDWGFDQYEQYKSSRGEAIEEITHYLKHEGAGSSIEAVSAVALMGMITGGFGLLPLLAGTAMSAVGIYNVTSKAANKEATAKALIAAMTNINYYRNLQERFFANDKSIIASPIINEYTARCDYSVINGPLDLDRITLITEGKEICFSKEPSRELYDEKPYYYLYIKDNNRSFTKLSITHSLGCFSELRKKNDYYVHSNENEYAEIFSYATNAVIKYLIASSWDNIERLLKSAFNHLAYDTNQLESETANAARIFHLHQRVKELQQNKDLNAVTEWTNICEHNNKKVISPIYQLPPHLAWHIIIGVRLLAYAESDKLLLEFRKQFHEYSKYIYDSAYESKSWFHANWSQVKKTLEQILEYALQQFIVAADKANTPEEKLLYLSEITQNYAYCDDWHIILKNDELKFWAAYMYHQLGKNDMCKLFFKRISNISELVRAKKQADFTENVLVLLADIDKEQHKKILLESQSGAIVISDNALFDHAIRLILNREFTEANNFLNRASDFKGILTARAYYIFESSSRTLIFEAIKQLAQEKMDNRGLIFWHLLYDMLKICLLATQYSRSYSNIQLEIFGLLKICADKIQVFPIPFDLKIETDQMIKISIDYLNEHIRNSDSNLSRNQISEEVNKLIEWGHKCMRGEIGFDLMTEIEVILHSISYDYLEDELMVKYLPIENSLEAEIFLFTCLV